MGGISSKGADDSRFKNVELLNQVVFAGGNFVGLRIAIIRGTTLYDVADEDVASVQAHLLDELSQKIACGTYKWPALQVFVLARSFSDEYHPGVGIPFPKDHVVTRFRQSAFHAVFDLGAQLFKSSAFRFWRWGLRDANKVRPGGFQKCKIVFKVSNDFAGR